MITSDMRIHQVMKMDMQVAPVFMSFGMHCLFCPHGSMETLEQAAAAHGVDVNELVAALNKYFDEKK